MPSRQLSGRSSLTCGGMSAADGRSGSPDGSAAGVVATTGNGPSRSTMHVVRNSSVVFSVPNLSSNRTHVRFDRTHVRFDSYARRLPECRYSRPCRRSVHRRRRIRSLTVSIRSSMLARLRPMPKVRTETTTGGHGDHRSDHRSDDSTSCRCSQSLHLHSPRERWSGGECAGAARTVRPVPRAARSRPHADDHAAVLGPSLRRVVRSPRDAPPRSCTRSSCAAARCAARRDSAGRPRPGACPVSG